MPNRFLIDVRDSTYTRRGVIESYTDFTAIIRYSDVGQWSLTLPGNAPECALLTPGSGIIVRIAGQATPLFSGPLTKIDRNWNSQTSNTGEATYSGVTDETLLFGRLTYPDPLNPLFPAQMVDSYLAEGKAGAVITSLVNLNCGPGALSARRYSQLDVTASTLGAVVSVNTRFDVLGERVQEIASGSGIGWRLRQGNSTRLTFDQYLPEDKTALIFGARFGNLVDYNYTLEAPTADTVILGAQGEKRYRYLEQYDYDPYLVERINDNDPRVVYVGAASYFPNEPMGEFNKDYTLQTSPAFGKRTQITFNGTGIRFFTRGLSGNTFRPTLDGVVLTDVVVPSTGKMRVKALEVTTLAAGEHTLWLSPVTGDLQIDYFEILDNRVTNDWRTRIEKFIDRGDIPVTYNNIYEAANPNTFAPQTPSLYRPQIDQALTEAWAEHAPKASLSITPLDTDEVQFGRDYSLGDRVSVEVDGSIISDVLREVRLTDGADGPKVSPIIGDSSATSSPAIYRQIRRVFAGLRRLEARK